MMKKLLVTHQNPDMDAIGGVWLLKRFDKKTYGEALVTFVPAGNQVDEEQLVALKVSLEETTHVDTGGVDFDHHDEKGVGQSAVGMILDYLHETYPELKKDEALSRMVAFIHKTDLFESYFWPEVTNDRYMFMLEDILNGFKLGGYGDDHDLLRLGSECLDGVYSIMKIRVEAEAELKAGLPFTTKFGKAIALTTSNDAVIKLGQKMGYTIVVRKDPNMGNIRIKAAPLSEIDLTPIYAAIVARDSVGTWYFHPGKHMLLNGSRKHMGQKASPLALDEVVEIIKSVK